MQPMYRILMSTTVAVDELEAPETVWPALAVCAERARWDGLALELTGDAAIES